MEEPRSAPSDGAGPSGDIKILLDFCFPEEPTGLVEPESMLLFLIDFWLSSGGLDALVGAFESPPSGASRNT